MLRRLSGRGMTEIAMNLERIEDRLRAACERVGRDRAQVVLVAVSKRQPIEAVHEAKELGVAVFAENYAKALRDRMAAVPDASWDFVGHVQSNKARYLVPGVRLIHSVSTASAARALSERADRAQSRVGVLVEIDTARASRDGAGEGSGARTGLTEDDAEELMGRVLALPGVDLRGLMALPPPARDAEESRPHFRRVRQLRDRLEERLDQALPELSMGMSGDFEVAVEEGATLVRIGTALFGSRPAPGGAV